MQVSYLSLKTYGKIYNVNYQFRGYLCRIYNNYQSMKTKRNLIIAHVFLEKYAQSSTLFSAILRLNSQRDITKVFRISLTKSKSRNLIRLQIFSNKLNPTKTLT